MASPYLELGLLPSTLLDGSFDNVCSFDVTCFQGDSHTVPDPKSAHHLQCELTCNHAKAVVLPASFLPGNGYMYQNGS